MELGPVLRDGFLYKRRDNKSWRKQWVVLRANHLSFAKGPKVALVRPAYRNALIFAPSFHVLG